MQIIITQTPFEMPENQTSSGDIDRLLQPPSTSGQNELFILPPASIFHVHNFPSLAPFSRRTHHSSQGLSSRARIQFTANRPAQRRSSIPKHVFEIGEGGPCAEFLSDVLIGSSHVIGECGACIALCWLARHEGRHNVQPAARGECNMSRCCV